MKNKFLAALGLVLMCSAGPVMAADQQDAEVMHWWTSGSEAQALKVFVKAFEDKGGHWVDHAVPDFESAIAAATTAIIGGNPPDALQFNAGAQFADLAEQGYLTDLSDIAKKEGWDKAFPASLMKAVSYNGKVYAIPVDNHGENWLWVNNKVMEKVGVTVPKSWDEFFPTLDKIKAAGIIPIAHGGEGWQELELFYQVMMLRNNVDLYKGLFVEGDIDVIKSAEFKAFVEDFKKLSDYIDPGAPGRKWNDATAMVIKGEAAMQFMGDWAKGEFTAAGMKPGTDYQCLNGFGGNDYFVISSDVFVFPKSSKEGSEKSMALLADVMSSPKVQVDFSKIKGSIPARLDADASSLDACAIKGFEAMQNPSAQVPGPEIATSADRSGAIQDAISEFWNSKSMSSDDFIANLVSAIEITDY
nr:ABC transporter substrate-binding protein [uncultured Cohaesibacter sp.]